MKRGLTILAVLTVSGLAQAADLRIGVSTEASSLDPHYHNVTPNNSVRRHIYESLVDQDAQQRLTPLLAESWRAVDDTTWEFRLRPGVTFHDGSPFTAQDVIYSVCRIPKVANSPSPFTIYTKAIASLSAPDPLTLVVKTATPYPLLPVEMSTFGIISAKAAGGQSVTFGKDGCSADAWPASGDFDGKLAIGTGPFRLAEQVKGDRLVLTRNEAYWGPKPEWQRVILRPITSDAPRVAALLAGDVDLITEPPLQDLERLRKDAKTRVVQALSNRVIYLSLDHAAEPTPTIQTATGKNPLKDLRVRKAMAMAIDRDAIVKRLMGGLAMPASQLLAPGLFGHNGAIALPHDPAQAKALLTEAGYPDGFQLTIGTPNDRYINDEKIAQAVAQMLTRIGIRTQVDAATASVFFPRRNKFEFSVYLAGWAAATGEASSPLKALVASQIKEKGYGGTNYGRYSNPALDGLLDQALRTNDDARREALLAAAMKVAADDVAVIPLHYEVIPWAMRKGLDYAPRADQYTLAQHVRTVR